MLGERLKAIADPVMAAGVSGLARRGLASWHARLIEVVLAGGCGLCYASGETAGAAALLVAHGVFDYLDGALRRARQSAGPAVGEPPTLQHAAADKVAEIAILVGVGAGNYAAWWLAGAALVTSVLTTAVGLTLARRYGVGRERTWFDRTDRVMALLLATLLSAVPVGLAVIVGMNCAILCQRVGQATALERGRR